MIHDTCIPKCSLVMLSLIWHFRNVFLHFIFGDLMLLLIYKNVVIVVVTLHSIGDNVHVTGIFLLATFHFQWWLWWVQRTQRHCVVYPFVTLRSSRRSGAKHEIPLRFITKLLHYSWYRCQIKRYWYEKFTFWMRKKTSIRNRNGMAASIAAIHQKMEEKLCRNRQ